MSSNRGFIWIDGKTNTSSSTSFSGESIVLNNPSTVSWTGGQTFITNNSLQTTNIDVDQITNNSNPVLFPDGLSGPDIFYNNAYVYDADEMTHWNDVVFKNNITVDTMVKTDRISSNTNDLLTIEHSGVQINGNLTVLGATTTISSANSNFADRYMLLNDGYVGTSGLSSGIISVRNTTAFSWTLGTFTTTTVATTGGGTLSAGNLIQITGSSIAANNGIFEVASHAANVLTIRTTPVYPWSLSAFTAGSNSTGSVRRYIASGLELDSSGVPQLVQDTVRQPIAFNTSSPSFAALQLTGILQDNAQSKLLALDGSNNTIWVDKATLLSATAMNPVYTSVSAPTFAGVTNLGSVTVNFVENVISRIITLEIANFSFVTASTSTLRIRAGDKVCARQLVFTILLSIAGILEECFCYHKRDTVIPANSELILVRKNGQNFLGTVTHGTLNLPGTSDTYKTNHTYSIALS